ncbi:type IV pilus assembly protein PilM [Desulfonatronum thioautotrophicum]|uniref:type IV pilus assembly protein PilM n=1 Tax=Desulfonatronum thioautotrophicum TaxID=617001 RepID=UPI0005EB186F|nr:type IV pilus assembly protein PilM [Desulfonatronum thioautotrophicum]
MPITIELRKKNPPPGVDLGSGWMKVVALGVRRRKPVLNRIGRIPLAVGDMDKGEKAADRLAELWRQLGVRERGVVSAMTGHAVIVKKVVVAADAAADMERFLAKEAKQYIPFDLQDVYIDHQRLGPGPSEGTVDVLLVASKKREVDERVQILTKAGLEVRVVDVDAFALNNCFEFNYPELIERPHYLLDIGGQLSVFCVVWNKQLVFHRELSLGGHQLTDRLAKLLNRSRAECEKLKINGPGELPATEQAVVVDELEDLLVSWAGEVRRLIGFYLGSVPEAKPAESMYLAGGGSLLAGLPARLSRELELDVQYLDPWRLLEPDPELFDAAYLRTVGPQYAVATGLALREAIP